MSRPVYVTPDLCDAYPDSISVVEPLFQSFGGRNNFGGEIFTVKCFEDNSRVKEQCSEPGKGKVMVVDGGGSLRVSLLGDLLGAKAVENGWEGLIIFGAVRDIDVLATLDLGVKAVAPIPCKSNRQGVGETQIPITFGGVEFQPGDFVYADNNGVVVSPDPLTPPEA